MRFIFFSHNLLSRLEGDQLSHLSGLRTLDLSFNRLSFLGSGLLQGSPLLVSLHLQGNQLETLLPDVLPSTGKLKMLQLAGNRWKCDCRLLHLPELPQSSPACPGQRLSFCPAKVISLSKLPELPSKLECHASGWPRPKITWLREGYPLDADISHEEEEELLRMPVNIMSYLPNPQSGRYTCQAGNSSLSIFLASESIASYPIGIGALVALSITLILLAFIFLFFCLWRKFHARQKDGKGLTTSLAGLEYRSTKMSTTNPVPKPPRTFTSEAATLPLVYPPPLAKGITFPPSTPNFLNKPRSRASIGTVSLNSAFFDASPCVSPRSSPHPCCGAPPGYATLPKRFIALPFGPRCSGDGSSIASLNLASGSSPFIPSSTNTPVLMATVNSPINTSGLPPANSPIPSRHLQTIEEQE